MTSRTTMATMQPAATDQMAPQGEVAGPPGRRGILLTGGAAFLLSACSVRPSPIGTAEALKSAQTDRERMFAGQEAPRGPLTIEHAMARALRYNLDARVAMLEQAMQASALEVSNLDMLPRLAANAGYTGRDRELASTSMSMRTRRESLENSISTDRNRAIADLGLSWNILDFGASYYMAKAQADRILVASERRRRSIHNIFQEVRGAYWQAAAAERLQGRVETALRDARRALDASRGIERRLEMPPLDALRYQRGLLDMIQQLETAAEDMRIAKARLAQLMGMAPGTPYTLAIPAVEHLEMPRVPDNIDKLEVAAITLRPEIQEERYNARIVQADARRALIRMMPGISLSSSLNYDSNSFLYYDRWYQVGAQSAMNLMALVQMPAQIELGKAQADVVEMRRMAIGMAVIAQVHIGLQNYAKSKAQFDTAKQIANVEGRMKRLIDSQGAADASTPLDRIRANVSAIAAELQRDRAYAALQSAHAAVHVSLGLEPVPEFKRDTELDAVAELIRTTQSRWASGHVDLPSVEEEAGPVGRSDAGADEKKI